VKAAVDSSRRSRPPVRRWRCLHGIWAIRRGPGVEKQVSIEGRRPGRTIPRHRHARAAQLDFTPAAFSGTLSEADIAMFRSSGITAFHNSIGVGGAGAYDDALSFIAAWSGFVGRHAELFSLVGKAEDIDRAKLKRRIAVIMGLQNADEFRDLKDVKTFHELGLRCAQLTYNSQNLLGGGSTDRVDGGISDYGVQIINAMNEAAC